MTTLPDIDLDFPRGLRDELIERVHRHFGPEYAVLTGAITTYKVKGIIQDLGKALGLPQEHLSLLSKQLHSHDASDLRDEMAQFPDFRDRVDAPGWRDLLDLAPKLMDAPKGLSQHVGGMVLSSSPIPEMVPMRAGAIDGRYIMDWNKDSVADAGFAKIDILSLPVLDQIEEALDLVEAREGKRPALSRADPGGRRGLRHDQRGPLQGYLPSTVARAAQDGAAAEVAQPPRPRLPGRPHPSRRRRSGQRRVAVRRALQARDGVGVRPPRWRGAPWNEATASSSGRSRSYSSSRTWPA